MFATRDYAEGETVEDCPAVLFSGQFSQIPAEVRQLLYHWAWAPNGKSIHCLPLGYGSLYNHANPSNMRYEAVLEARVLRFSAARAIVEGEELTSNYNSTGGDHRSEGEEWFGRMGVTPYEEEPAAETPLERPLTTP